MWQNFAMYFQLIAGSEPSEIAPVGAPCPAARPGSVREGIPWRFPGARRRFAMFALAVRERFESAPDVNRSCRYRDPCARTARSHRVSRSPVLTQTGFSHREVSAAPALPPTPGWHRRSPCRPRRRTDKPRCPEPDHPPGERALGAFRHPGKSGPKGQRDDSDGQRRAPCLDAGSRRSPSRHRFRFRQILFGATGACLACLPVHDSLEFRVRAPPGLPSRAPSMWFRRRDRSAACPAPPTRFAARI